MVSPESAGYCPAYFNYGFVAFNAAGFERVRPLIPVYTRYLQKSLANTQQLFFAAQIALSLAIIDAGLDVIELGPAYNCPNSDEMLRHGLKDPGDIMVMHYLRNDAFDRHTFLSNFTAFETFCAANFESSIVRAFQAHVRKLPGVFYGETPLK
jgi:hypothetical protein